MRGGAGRLPARPRVPAGVRTTDGEHELDVLVYATGFDAPTGPLLRMDIRGPGDVALADRWAEGPRTFLGLAVPGFPNLFTVTGPGSPSVLTDMPVAIEQHVEWIAACLAAMRDRGAEVFEATEHAADEWTAHVQEVAHMTLHPKAASWYMGANIPGKPRLFLPYVGGLDADTQRCEAVRDAGYEGFDIAAQLQPA